MIYYIGSPVDGVPVSSFNAFMDWAHDQSEYQFDIETNVTPWWCERVIITVQFGDINDTTQWVMQWSFLNDVQKAFVKWILEGRKIKLIHNAQFECTVCLFHDIRVQNMYDTMLMEMMLNCGLLNYGNDEDEETENPEEATFYSLSGLCIRYLCYWMEKSEYQMSFGDDTMSQGKIIYAAGDVRPLGFIRRMQILEIGHNDLDYVAALENEAVLGFSMMTYNGMELNVEKWRDNISLATPIVEQARKDLAKAVIDDNALLSCAITNGWYDKNDRVTINWNSPPQKDKIFRKFFPELPGGTKAVLTRWLKSGLGTTMELECVNAFIDKRYSVIEEYLVLADREWLIEHEMLIPGGELTINWNSAPQKLKLLQTINPRLQNTDKKALEKVNHVIQGYIINYGKAQKLLSTYGEKFLLHIEPDGKVRTVFKQIVSTGRVGSRPNLQNLPNPNDDDPLRYRNAFICSPNEVFVGSDYSSQELCVVAYMSQDSVWIGCLNRGEDLHSVSAELVYGTKWKQAADSNCAYYINKQKCNCKKHKVLRNSIKSIGFGLIYGMSHFKLAADLHITIPEAKALIEKYFTTFPKIKQLLNTLGQFGVTKGYIMTLAPFFRKRWFPYWKFVRNNIEHFLAGVIHDSTLGSIDRQSRNQPVQGSSADICKLALVLIYHHMSDNDLWSKVKLKMQVHDSLDTTAIKEYAEEWEPVFTSLMEQAALMVVPNGLLKAETKITEVWSK